MVRFAIACLLALELVHSSQGSAGDLTSGGRSNCDHATQPSSSSDQLRLLRYKLDHDQISGYIIPATDVHLSPYPADRDRRLQYLTGFSGTDGLAIVLANTSVLVTDGRYQQQADEQLTCDWQLIVSSNTISAAISWIKVNVDQGSKVAADARLIGQKNVSLMIL